MNVQPKGKINKLYLYAIVLLMLVMPAISILIEWRFKQHIFLGALIGKWFVFWAVGLRLLTAGLRQVAKPAFTAREIFHLEDSESHVIVRELGFANVCIGLTAVLSVGMSELRPAAAITGGLYMGIAGVYHIARKPAGANEILAMVSDLFILLVMAAYLWSYFMKS